MRILATNPDALGDLVLREPLYAGLAGHELALVVRGDLVPLAERIAPGAVVLGFEASAYASWLSSASRALDEVAARACGFSPDLVLVAPFQWTPLDARIARACAPARVVRLSGHPGRFVDPEDEGSRLDGVEVVAVDEGAHEVEKNRRLLGRVRAIGGDLAAVEARDPRLAIDDVSDRAARGVLGSLGLDRGGYWAACVGDSAHTRVRNWPVERWGRLLARAAAERGERFLLIGHAEERESMLEAAGVIGASARVWTGGRVGEDDADSLPTLLGLVAHSRGYIGRDTGPMHVAGALGRPVLAIFGGGTYPRFLPCAAVSVALTTEVPCAGCGWRCHLSSPVCIEGVEEVEARAALDRFLAGEVRGREVASRRASEEVLVGIAREGALLARRGDPGRSPGEEAGDAARHGRARARQADKIARLVERAEEAEREIERLRLAASPAADPVPVAAPGGGSGTAREATEAARAVDRDALEAEAASLRSLAASLRGEVNDLRARVARLQEDAAAASALAARARSSHDRAREEADRAGEKALASEARVREAEARLGEALSRLEELASSAWSRLGRRLRVTSAREPSRGDDRR